MKLIPMVTDSSQLIDFENWWINIDVESDTIPGPPTMQFLRNYAWSDAFLLINTV